MLRKLLDRPISVTMILLVFVVLGIVGIGRLPVSLIPDVDIPYVTVQVSAPDLSARELNDAVVTPLRQSLVQIAYLKDIRSEAKDGSATMTLSFEEGQEIDYFYIEVNEKIDRAMGSLPRIDRPKVFKASATDIPAFYINMTLREEGGNFLRMSEFAQDVIAKRIEQLPEVAMVDLSGGAAREILVVPDLEVLARLGLSVSQFERSVSSANVTLSNLTIRDGEYHYSVKFQSFAGTCEDRANVYFKAGDRVLQVKDVARVTEQEAPRTGFARSDGRDAVVLAVIKQSEARMAKLKQSIAEQLDIFREDYPQMEFSMSRDQTELLDYSIRNLLLNILMAILLDIVVIFFFMKDLRSPLLVALTIPVSLVISFFVFYAIGLTINIISLSGLLLGVGMMAGEEREKVRKGIASKWIVGKNPIEIILGQSTVIFTIYVIIAVYLACVVPVLFDLVHIWRWQTLLAFMVPYIAACVFFSISLSSIAHDRESFIIMFVFISIPLLFASGISWPASNIPIFWKGFSWLFPSTFGINGYVRITEMGATLEDVQHELNALWIQTFVYMGISYLVYKRTYGKQLWS